MILYDILKFVICEIAQGFPLSIYNRGNMIIHVQTIFICICKFRICVLN